jgi:hypothetical protein
MVAWLVGFEGSIRLLISFYRNRKVVISLYSAAVLLSILSTLNVRQLTALRSWDTWLNFARHKLLKYSEQ